MLPWEIHDLRDFEQWAIFFSDTLVQASQKPDDFLGFSALQLLKKPNSAAVLRVVS